MRYNKKLNEMSRPVGSKIVSLPKYGFVRAPEEDFTDDGARFTAFWYDPEGKGEKDILATKTTYNGEVFISIRYTLPGTSKGQYIDDLNGVSAEKAIEEMPNIIKKLEEVKKKIASFTAQTLTDEEIEELSNEVAEKASKDNAWRTAEEVLKQHNIDEDQLESSVAMKYRKAWEAKVKNKFTSTLSKDKLRALAADFLRRAIIDYSTTYNFDKAIENAYASIRDKDGYISINDLDDATVERMKKWAKRKLTSADDFE